MGQVDSLLHYNHLVYLYIVGKTTAFGVQFLAVRGVRKDEELVKSMDRLR